MDDKKERTFSFSLENFTDRIVLLVVLGILGGPGIISMVVPSARPLAFTSEDGAKLEDRMEFIRTEIRRECEKNLSFLQSQIDDIESADAKLQDEHNAHLHVAPPVWVDRKLKFLQSEIDKTNQRVTDHNTYAEIWKHRIVVLEEKQRKQ